MNILFKNLYLLKTLNKYINKMNILYMRMVYLYQFEIRKKDIVFRVCFLSNWKTLVIMNILIQSLFIPLWW